MSRTRTKTTTTETKITKKKGSKRSRVLQSTSQFSRNCRSPLDARALWRSRRPSKRATTVAPAVVSCSARQEMVRVSSRTWTLHTRSLQRCPVSRARFLDFPSEARAFEGATVALDFARIRISSPEGDLPR